MAGSQIKKTMKSIQKWEKQIRKALGDAAPIKDTDDKKEHGSFKEFLQRNQFEGLHPLEIGDRVHIWTVRGDDFDGDVTDICSTDVPHLKINTNNGTVIPIRYYEIYSIIKVEKDEVATTTAAIAPVPMRLIQDKRTGKTWIGKIEGPYPAFMGKTKQKKRRKK